MSLPSVHDLNRIELVVLVVVAQLADDQIPTRVAREYEHLVLQLAEDKVESCHEVFVELDW